MSGPLSASKPWAMVPLHVAPGDMIGPDGRRLEPFARFAAWIKDGEEPRTVEGEHSVARLPDGGVLVIDGEGKAMVIAADGGRHEIPAVPHD